MDISAKLALIVPVLLCLNIVLSAAAQIMAALGKKEIPVLSQAAVIIGKLIDIVSANSKH